MCILFSIFITAKPLVTARASVFERTFQHTENVVNWGGGVRFGWVEIVPKVLGKKNTESHVTHVESAYSL